MSDHADLIARLEAELAKARARLAADEHTRLSEERQPEPEPGPSMYAGFQHPDEAHERVLASGHGVAGHPGLAAGVTN